MDSRMTAKLNEHQNAGCNAKSIENRKTKKWNIMPGNPLLQGVLVEENSVNFCVTGESVNSCFLLLYKRGSDVVSERIEFTGQMRFGNVFAMKISGIPYEKYEYNYEMNGKVCMDERAQSVTYRKNWGGEKIAVPRAQIVKNEFCWDGDVKPDTPFEESLIYKLHVRGFTKHASSKVKNKGTYEGIIEKIPYLKQLGVTMVELMPAYEFDEVLQERQVVHGIPAKVMQEISEKPIENGAENVSGDCAGHMTEGDTSHVAGNDGVNIGESNAGNIGECNAGNIAGSNAGNIAGSNTGNITGSNTKNIAGTLQADIVQKQETKLNYWGYDKAFYFAPKRSYAADKKHPEVSFKKMVCELHRAGIEVGMEFYFVPGTNPGYIVDCLRHWVIRYHIDCVHVNLDVAPSEMLQKDPILATTKMLGANWGIPEGNIFDTKAKKKYLAGVEDTFMVHARKFLKSDEDQVGPMTYHMKHNPLNYSVIHYVANQNSFTLMDTVSYDRKHNEPNGEHNQDGTDYNYSWNCGCEGKTRKKKINQMREKQIKNILLFLMMSQGTPMIMAGDEMGHTQLGNNNPYCQDNDTSWLNWNNLKKNSGIYEFFKELVAFRKQHTILHMAQEPRMMDYRSIGCPDLSYHSDRAWYSDCNHICRHFGVMFGGEYAYPQTETEKIEQLQDRNIYVAYNMHWETQQLGVPSAKKGYHWVKKMDTAVCEASQKHKKADGSKEEAKNCKNVDGSNVEVQILDEEQRTVAVAPRSAQVYVEVKKEEHKTTQSK